MHLHGHTFQVIKADGTRGAQGHRHRAGDAAAHLDVVADNPGEWMLHCHNSYHQEAEMMTRLNYIA
jgi:FtsP/CotA-like multicopper oxidase with cupredoxin domain